MWRLSVADSTCARRQAAAPVEVVEEPEYADRAVPEWTIKADAEFSDERAEDTHMVLEG